MLNIFWLIFFGWWFVPDALSLVLLSALRLLVFRLAFTNFKIAAIARSGRVGRRVVSVEVARAASWKPMRRRFE